MRHWLPWALLALVLGRHYAVDVMALAFSEPERARRALFYVSSGLQGASLFALLWWLLPRSPVVLYRVSALACAWGILEELQVAVCRIAAGIENPVRAPMWRGLCDAGADLPLSTITLAIPVLIVLWLLGKGD